MTDVGILSVAHLHADAYAPLVAEHAEATLAGVADEDAERAEAFAARHDTTARDRDELLDRVDGVVVCGTNADHPELVRAAADADVDVLCEKPLATDAETARELTAYCEDAGVSLGVAMPLRFSRPVEEAASLLAEDHVGDVQSISGTNRGQMPGDWFVDPDQSGGGATMDHTVHIVDLVHALTGLRVTEVYAETATRMHDLAVEDVNVLSMELEDGTSFLLDGSWSKPDDWRFWGDATVEFVGEDGTVSVDCFDQTTTRTVDGEGAASLYWGYDPNAGLVDDFVTALRTGSDPAVSGTEGADAVAVVEAAYESAASGEPVAVSYE